MLDSQGNQIAQIITTRQKLAVAFLLSFTLLMIGLSVYGMKTNLAESLTYSGEQKRIADVEADATSTDEYLKGQDTDKDTVTDYDELKVYNTSAFLPDTDGDNLPDGDELKNGTDPLCPEGQVCNDRGALYNVNSGVGASSSEMMQNGQKPVFTEEQLKQMQQVGQLADIQVQIDAMGQVVGSTSVANGAAMPALVSSNTQPVIGLDTSDKAQAQAILKGGASAANLREALSKAGLPKEQLDQISDEALLSNYREMLNKQKQ